MNKSMISDELRNRSEKFFRHEEVGYQYSNLLIHDLLDYIDKPESKPVVKHKEGCRWEIRIEWSDRDNGWYEKGKYNQIHYCPGCGFKLLELPGLKNKPLPHPDATACMFCGRSDGIHNADCQADDVA